MSERGEPRAWMREGLIALCYLAFVVAGVATVLWPALESSTEGDDAAGTQADAGVP